MFRFSEASGTCSCHAVISGCDIDGAIYVIVVAFLWRLQCVKKIHASVKREMRQILKSLVETPAVVVSGGGEHHAVTTQTFPIQDKQRPVIFQSRGPRRHSQAIRVFHGWGTVHRRCGGSGKRCHHSALKLKHTLI